jgi:hypothetical protein
MSKVVLDAATLSKLNGFKEQIEVYDESGNLLGFVQPVEMHLMSVDLDGPDPFSDEQIAETLRTEDRGISTAELLRRLRNL